MSTAFHEDYQSPHRDPVDSRSMEFPWEEVLARLDGEPMPDELIEKFAAGLGEIVVWLVSDLRGAPRLETVLARRALALAWVLRPQAFEGSPSLRTLSDRLKIPVKKLSRQTVSFSNRFGVHNRAQAPHYR